MREITGTISARGQITIPLEVQHLLGVRPKDQVAFVIDQGQVRLVPVRFTLESAMGSVEPGTDVEDFEAIIQQAKDERAARSRAKFES